MSACTAIVFPGMYLVQTTEVEKCIIKMGMEPMYWTKLCKVALTNVRQGVTLISP
jgi:hypothetical protein